MAILSGKRPSRPLTNTAGPVLDDLMWILIEACWKQNAADRITSTETVQVLQMHVQIPLHDANYMRHSFLWSSPGPGHTSGLPTASRLLPEFPVLRGVILPSKPHIISVEKDVWKVSIHGHYVAIMVPRVYLKTDRMQAMKVNNVIFAIDVSLTD